MNGGEFEVKRALSLLEDKFSFGYWIWDLETGTTEWSQGLYQVLGIPRGACAPSIEAIEQAVHIEDRVSRSSIEGALKEAVAFDRQFRIVTSDGRIRWVRCRIEPVVAAKGAPFRAIGICHDITEQREEVHFIKRSRDRFRTICHHTNAVIWVSTPDGGQIELLSRRNGRSTDFRSMLHPEDAVRLSERLLLAEASPRPFEIALRLSNPDGTYRLYHSRVAPVEDRRGRTSEWIGVCRDARDVVTARGVNGSSPGVLTGMQMRSARAMLRWSVADLAQVARVSPTTIRRLEETNGASPPEEAHGPIYKALSEAGMEFIYSMDSKPGVRPL